MKEKIQQLENENLQLNNKVNALKNEVVSLREELSRAKAQVKSEVEKKNIFYKSLEQAEDKVKELEAVIKGVSLLLARY